MQSRAWVCNAQAKTTLVATLTGPTARYGIGNRDQPSRGLVHNVFARHGDQLQRKYQVFQHLFSIVAIFMIMPALRPLAFEVD